MLILPTNNLDNLTNSTNIKQLVSLTTYKKKKANLIEHLLHTL